MIHAFLTQFGLYIAAILHYSPAELLQIIVEVIFS